jgi:hypothetical protein
MINADGPYGFTPSGFRESDPLAILLSFLFSIRNETLAEHYPSVVYAWAGLHPTGATAISAIAAWAPTEDGKRSETHTCDNAIL